jgi:hypothetical protein
MREHALMEETFSVQFIPRLYNEVQLPYEIVLRWQIEE